MGGRLGHSDGGPGIPAQVERKEQCGRLRGGKGEVTLYIQTINVSTVAAMLPKLQ